MATKYWIGNAAPVAQVDYVTPANVEIGDVFTLGIDAHSVSFTATAATVADVTAGLVALWNASLSPLLSQITAADETTHIKLTADTAGIPFTTTASVENTSGGTDDQTLTVSTEVESFSPNDWSDGDNWSDGSAPTGGDTVVFENGSVPVYWGLDQSAITLAALYIRASYTGSIGLPATQPNLSGGGFAGSYREYREQYLKVSATSLIIGEGSGNGSGLLKINTGSAQTAIKVYKTGTQYDSTLPSFMWKGTHASNIVDIVSGSFGAAVFTGETATIAALYTRSSTASVALGPGVTWTAIAQNGGTVRAESNGTSWTQESGTGYLTRAATLGTLVCNGTFYDQSTGTLTAGTVQGSGTLDLTGCPGKTISALDLYAGATLNDPDGKATLSAGIDLNRCTINDVTLNLPSNKRITLGSVA